MQQQHIQLIQSTVPVLRENGVALTSYFYKRMLNHNPELKNTFNLEHQSTGRQPRALAAAVLAYAENIEDPSRLQKAVERITTKHVTLNIQPEQYAIVGHHLLHSISEVLDLPMTHEIIGAWEQAYQQLANLLISVEQQKYAVLEQQEGGWKAWRSFAVSHIEANADHKQYYLRPVDQQAIAPLSDKAELTIKVKVPEQDLEQPQHFHATQNENGDSYIITLKHQAEGSEFNVTNILLQHYELGDVVELSAPFEI